MKKLLALLIAMCMVASLAACGGSGSSGGDATEAAAETEAARKGYRRHAGGVRVRVFFFAGGARFV